MRTDYHPRFQRVAPMAGDTARTGPLCGPAAVHCLQAGDPLKQALPYRANYTASLAKTGKSMAITVVFGKTPGRLAESATR